MGNLYVSAYGRSNVGKKRGNNEDNFFLSGVTVDSAMDINAMARPSVEAAFAVFDGMGGEAAGERASQITAITYGQKMESMLSGDFSPVVMQDAIEAANKKVCDEIRVIGKRMGCTFASLGFKNDTIHVSNVGDSRVYLLRDGVLHCISKDHTVAQTMVDAGIVSYEASQHSKEKHQLTQHIGIFPEEMIIEPFYNNLKANDGDILLVCSDGLTDMLSDAEIGNILASGGSEQALTNALVEDALVKGGKDNVTVIVAKVSGAKASAPIVADKKSNAKIFAIIAGIVAILVLGAVALLLIMCKDDSDKGDKDLTEKESVVTVVGTEGATTTDKVEDITVDTGSDEDLNDDDLDETEPENEEQKNDQGEGNDKNKDDNPDDVQPDNTEDEESDDNGNGSILGNIFGR